MKKEYKTAFLTFQMIINFFIELAVSMTIGYFLGRWIDSLLFVDRHIFVIVCIFLGLIASLVNLFRKIIRMTGGGKKDDDKKS